MKTHDKAHEPLLHIVKRSAPVWWRAWLIRVIAVVAALIFSGVISFFLTGKNPIEIYATMLDGAFGTERRIWNLFQALAMLLCVSLAVTPAFKMRFWNIGAEGQALIGGFAAAACMLKIVVDVLIPKGALPLSELQPNKSILSANAPPFTLAAPIYSC